MAVTVLVQLQFRKEGEKSGPHLYSKNFLGKLKNTYSFAI